MLHYLDYSNEIINIGICDWRILSRFDENAPSHYGKPTDAERDQYRQGGHSGWLQSCFVRLGLKILIRAY